MKNIKFKNIIIVLLFLTAIACEEKKDPFEESNQAPQVSIFNKNTGALEKSFSDSIKLGQTYQTSFAYFDEDTATLKIVVRAYSGTVTRNGNKISLVTTEAGTNYIEIEATDKYGKKIEARIDLYVFANRNPVGILKVTKHPTIPMAVILDASESYDPDAKYGDKISIYKFIRVATNEPFIDSEKSEIIYILNDYGNHKFVLLVKDSEGLGGAETVATINYTAD